MSWDDPTAAWWSDEVRTDPAYRRDVDRLLHDLVGEFGGRWLDLGCGNGRLLATTGAVGLEQNAALVAQAARQGPVVAGTAEVLPFTEAAFDGVYVVLVLEHLAKIGSVFAEVARVTRRGGTLAVVLNHPLYTAPGSGPFIDPEDGEVLWRWGGYLSSGATREPAGSGTVEFLHRPIGHLLTLASRGGWDLERVEERSLEPAGDPLLAAQTEIPRLLGLRWRLRASDTPGG